MAFKGVFRRSSYVVISQLIYSLCLYLISYLFLAELYISVLHASLDYIQSYLFGLAVLNNFIYNHSFVKIMDRLHHKKRLYRLRLDMVSI